MLVLKFLLIATGATLLAVLAAVLGYNVYQYVAARKRLEAAEAGREKLPEPELKLRVHLAGMICGVAIVSFLLSNFDAVPAGHTAIRVSQFRCGDKVSIAVQLIFPTRRMSRPTVS